ncbi:potassium channel family protein [Phenylobacterium sp.]|jgi:voltage-gated potassium channel Kch|uniref:potassium channel family protein n=1 Tax=Phenylobacterium sp. TaxID=1871053 RepID=UPI002F3F7FF3
MKRTVPGLLDSPLRNLAAVVAFMLALIVVTTGGYMAAGWSFADAVYMVILTVYSVGYEEVRPIDTPALHALTIAVIAFGCTGMIILTGALVQVFTIAQISQIMGSKRVNTEIDRLKDHVIICGFGRIGVMLAADLRGAAGRFVVMDRSEARIAEARSLGYLCLQADAADEAALRAAGVARARVLATVLPDDAANVFITLTARSLNRELQIIARGEQPSTESKLIYAGANKVVLPTHIGAERIAEMILHPETARFLRGSERMIDFEKTLRNLGLYLEMVTVPAGSRAVGDTIGDLEQRARGAFYVVQVDRREGDTITRPEPTVRVEAGDGLLVVSRAEIAAVTTILQAPPERVRAGRSRF